MNNKKCLRSVDLLTQSGVQVTIAARALGREPASLVTRTLKLWGDDEDPFRHLINSRTADARVWRRTMESLLCHLMPETTGRTVWRGWYFKSAAARKKLLRQLEQTGSL